jgi:hypothetical protein
MKKAPRDKSSFKPSKIPDVPAGESYVQHWRKLIESRAYRSLSRYAFLALTRLEAEHCAHAGKENGWLIVTYDQFAKWGVPRKWIKPALTELVDVKLLVIEREGRAAKLGHGVPALYRLTYLKSKLVPIAGAPRYVEPSGDWQAFEDSRVPIPPKLKPAKNNNIASLRRSAESVQKTDFSVPHAGTEPVPHAGTERDALMMDSRHFCQYPTQVLLSTLRGTNRPDASPAGVMGALRSQGRRLQ